MDSKKNVSSSTANEQAKIGLSQISRRDFLKATGAILLVSGTSACGLIPSAQDQGPDSAPLSPTSTHTPSETGGTESPEASESPTPQPTHDKNRAEVAFVKTADRAEGIHRAIALLGSNPADGKTVLLKPNFNSADSAPGSTHNDTLRTLTQSLWEMGAASITVADRSGMGDTRQVMRRKGVLDMAEELGFEVIVLDELDSTDWTLVQPPSSHWSQGFLFPQQFLDADVIIQTCCLKTHRYGGHFTMSLKNSVGMVAKFGENGYNYMGELHNSEHQRAMIAEINSAYEPGLVILDAVEAFVTGGPGTGKRVQSEVMLAGTDRVALDAVGVAILRHFGTTPEVERGRIFEQEQIARAVELGLGVSRPEDIELLTDDTTSAEYAALIQEILLS